MKDNPSKMFQAIKHMQKMKHKTPLLIRTETGELTANENDQAKIIAKHFKSQFHKEHTNVVSKEPVAMKNPFTKEEVEKAVHRLKNNKAEGCDGIKAELLKHCPTIIYQQIANIYNVAAATGDSPKELIHGIITALQKPGKEKGPVENLGPITLLSMLRKILAICMKERINGRMEAKIPASQAAYRSGRSTTEHVFATKVLSEKALTSKNHPIFIMILDMSKAFDTVNRETLIN